MSRSTSNFIWIIANVILFIIGALFNVYERFYFILAVIGAVQLTLALYINVKSEKNMFSPLIVYEVVMYLFLFGQCLMWIITEDFSGRNIIDIYSKNIIIKAEEFTLVSMFFFHLALFNTSTKKIKITSELRTNQLRASMYLCGKILLCMTIIPEIVYNIRIFTIAQTYGYRGIYDVQTGAIMQMFLTLREFFFPGVVMTLCGDVHNNKKLRNSLMCIILLDACVSLYVGSRSDAMMQIISLALILQIVNKEETKRSKKTTLKYGLLILALIIIANVVRTVRNMPDRDILTFFEYLFSEDESSDNMLIGIMGELGGTMGTLIETMLLVPSDFGFLYGTSYLYALTWLIPGGLTDNLWEKASMNNWIDTVRYTGSGWGFSTTAEAYYNFGFAGVLVFLLVGFAVGKLFKKLDREYFEKNPIEFALSFILFNRLLIFSRIDFLSMLPSVVYFYFGIKIVIYLVDYFNRMKGGKI